MKLPNKTWQGDDFEECLAGVVNSRSDCFMKDKVMKKELHVNIINSDRLEDRIKELETWQAEARPLLKTLWSSLEYKKRVHGAGLDVLRLKILDESMNRLEKLLGEE